MNSSKFQRNPNGTKIRYKKMSASKARAKFEYGSEDEKNKAKSKALKKV